MTLLHPSTFSLVAHDPEEHEWGVAVASKFLSVGAVVPWARAGVGAIATQSYANTSFGPKGLELMAQGQSAHDTLERLLTEDDGRNQRQVGVVDGHGRGATFTGEECYSWAGGTTGENYAAQGNILTGCEVVDRMAESFEDMGGVLADRLLAGLRAGQEAGGDSRGQQSAALLVVKPEGGYAGFNDRYIDLRVDDHATPIAELERLLDMHKLYMFDTRPEDIVLVDEAGAVLIHQILVKAGYRDRTLPARYDDETRDAFRALCGRENLEDRWREGNEVDGVVLDYLTEKYEVPVGPGTSNDAR